MANTYRQQAHRDDPFWRSLGEALRAARERAGLTTEQVSDELRALGWTMKPEYILNYDEVRQAVSVKMLRDLATIYNISVDSLFDVIASLEKGMEWNML